jgi:ABC-type branched-subunit amino acid transport system substrate-binding protein
MPSFVRQRGAYDFAALKRAISHGVNAEGMPLGIGMPRYQMSDDQIDGLIGYLRIIGTSADSDPGIGEDFVTVGAVLPLTGSMAKIGTTVAARLRGVFDGVNAQGGIYRRRILLTIEDSRSDGAAAMVAMRRLVEGGVFALVASFQPPDNPTLDGLIASAGIPSIGPLTQAPREPARQNANVWYLLPTFSDQARVLVDYINSAGRRHDANSPLRVAIVHADTPDANDAMRGAKTRLVTHQATITSDLKYESGPLSAAETARLATNGNPDWILFFGSAMALKQFSETFAASPELLPAIGALTMLSPLPQDSLRAINVDMIFASPVGWTKKVNMIELEASGPISGNSIFQVIAVGAAKTLIEAMSRAGRTLNRISLAAELNQLHGFDTGVLPPVNFASNNHVGLGGAVIFRFDRRQKQYMPVTSWQLPADIYEKAIK